MHPARRVARAGAGIRTRIPRSLARRLHLAPPPERAERSYPPAPQFPVAAAFHPLSVCTAVATVVLDRHFRGCVDADP
jgi:hypothetical protein